PMRACARSWPSSAQCSCRANTTRHAITMMIAAARMSALRTLREIGARQRTVGGPVGALGDRGEVLVADAAGEVIPVVAHRGPAIELALAHARHGIELD